MPPWKMLTNEEKKHYARQLILPNWGEEKQLKLKTAKVLVVGAGGLGCPALQYLAGAGVGILGIADGDTVDVTNLHRQILYTQADAGKNKARAAADRLAASNPYITYKVYEAPLSNSDALNVISDYDLVLDGTDNFATRYLINDACVILKKPFVYGGITGFEGQLSVFNYGGGPTYRCLYPEPPPAGSVLACVEAGVIGMLPGLIGTMQAIEAIKILASLGEVLAGQLSIINVLSNQRLSLRVTLDPKNLEINNLSDYKAFCATKDSSVPEISAEELKKSISRVYLLDVREADEVARFTIGGQCIPLKEIEARLAEIPIGQEIVVICQSGKRSKAATQQLLEKGYPQVRSLAGGLSGWFA